jgi:hypothetical protein
VVKRQEGETEERRILGEKGGRHRAVEGQKAVEGTEGC